MITQFPINDFTGPNYAPPKQNNQTFAKELQKTTNVHFKLVLN